MVSTLAEASAEDIEVDAITSTNANLVEHLNNPDTRDAVRTGNYDYVILQQGPSSLSLNRESLRQSAREWNEIITAGGARAALFAVWPENTRQEVFPDVSESYRLAAQDVNGLFLPVGDTWLEVWKAFPAAPFYSEDGYTPSRLGTYAAAVVIVSALTSRDPTSLSDVAIAGFVDPALLPAVRAAARTVLRR
jgi:hypothetical protein